MRSVAILVGLLGTALAAPYASIGRLHRRAEPENKYTIVKPGNVDDVIVDEDNTLNGTFHTQDSFSISSAEIRDPVAGNLPLSLVNNLGGENVNCYISGLDSDGKVVFLAADGTLIYPSSGGSEVPVPVTEPVAIPMPPQGQTLDITLPIAMSSGRVYFAQGELQFFMVFIGTGDGLVQPSINNIQDPSAGLNWGFVELTLTTEGVIWANISYVDFVGLIMSMTLRNLDGSTQEVIGLPGNAVQTVCEQLLAQGTADSRPWGAMCIARADGVPLRVLSPEDYETVEQGGFDDYWTAYVDEVWAKYSSQPLTINTQNADIGQVKCQVNGDLLECEGDNRGYPKPNAADIWGCNSGPFGILEGDNAVHYAVVPRLCAAFVRTTFTIDGGDFQPGPAAESYYTLDPTSHYSRIIHANEVDGKGYAFPYDDVNPDGAEDAAGLVSSGNPETLIFYVGGAQ
jgi:hypothetical protein